MFAYVEKDGATPSQQLSGDGLNEKAVRALIRARVRLGYRERAPFARLLQEAGVEVDTSTYNRWEEAKARTPAFALLAAAELSGQTLDELLGDVPDSRLAQVERELNALKEEFARTLQLLQPLLAQNVESALRRVRVIDRSTSST